MPSLKLQCIILFHVWFSEFAWMELHLSFHFSLDVCNNQIFPSHVSFCTISCHNLLPGCWRLLPSVIKISYSVVPLNVWTLTKSSMIVNMNVSNRAVWGISQLLSGTNKNSTDESYLVVVLYKDLHNYIQNLHLNTNMSTKDADLFWSYKHKKWLLACQKKTQGRPCVTKACCKPFGNHWKCTFSSVCRCGRRVGRRKEAVRKRHGKWVSRSQQKERECDVIKARDEETRELQYLHRHHSGIHRGTEPHTGHSYPVCNLDNKCNCLGFYRRR